MQLDNTTVVIRPRSPWEAVDLGIQMANQWLRPILLSWFAVTLPIYALLMAILPEKNWLPLLILWWLKPWWDRIPLYFLSRSIFGETPGVLQTVRAWPGLVLRSPFAFMLYRINGRRSLLLPVRVLENLKGKKRRQRERQLCAEDVAPATWLTILGIHIETFLFFSFYSLFLVFFPDQFEGNLIDYMETMETGTGFFNNSWLGFLCMGLVSPYYIASGFSLYLNRRIHLEGWDLEIAFRRMAARTRPVQGRSAAAVLLLIFTACLFTPDHSALAAEETMQPDPAQARSLIETTLEGEEFHQLQTSSVPRLREDSEILRKLVEWLEEHLFGNDNPGESGVPVFAMLLEVLLWTCLFALIAFLLWHYRSLLRSFILRQPASMKGTGTSALSMLEDDTGELSVPEDLIGLCRRLWQNGQQLQAMTLLYRASVHVFAENSETVIPASATERECQRLIQNALGRDKAAYFIELNRAWIFLAYGQVSPSEATFTGLCDLWQSRWADIVRPRQQTEVRA